MFSDSLIRSLVHSSYSTLAALNIGRFGCGMSLRSCGWMRGPNAFYFELFLFYFSVKWQGAV